jgi:O-antigen ligase
MNPKINNEEREDQAHEQSDVLSWVTQLRRIHFFVSTSFLIFCFVLHIFIRPYGAFPWLNLVLFAIVFTTTVVNPYLAIGLLTFVVPFTANIYAHIKAIFNSEFFTLDLLSIDASIGFLAGLLVLELLTRKWKISAKKIPARTEVLTFLVVSFQVVVIMTVAIGISRNLYQSASPYFIKGFFYNLANIRSSSWFDDYFPLRDLFIFTTVITLGLSLLSLIRTKLQLMWSVLCPLLLATVIILYYALWSKFTGIGYYRDGATIGANSFFPDLHAYGGYALAAFLGGLYYLTSDQPLVKWTARVFSLLAAAGVIVSASRFSIMMLFLASIGYVSFFLIKQSKKYLLPSIVVILSFISAVFLLKYWGDRGLLQNLAMVLKAKSFEDINLALSYRPEIFRSALLMYSHYPILGLGKGNFFRESSIGEFSGSYFFSILNKGENAHNYFLQILAETGIIGLSLFCAIFIYQACYLRNRHNKIVTVLIVGIFLGNLYGHSLLIPNILVLLFILLGCSNTEVQEGAIPANLFYASFAKPQRYLLIAAATILVIVTAFEVKSSYGKMPFQQRFVCNEPMYYGDNQVGGVLEQTYKVVGNTLKLKYTIYHPDTQVHPLTISFNLKQAGQTIANYERIINLPGSYEEKFDISQLILNSDISLQVKASRCLTPINWGLNWDNRQLAFLVNSLTQDQRVVQGK